MTLAHQDNEAILYRTQTEAPTEPGDYYARLKSDPKGQIVSVFVAKGFDFVFVAGVSRPYGHADFDFFGPAIEVREG